MRYCLWLILVFACKEEQVYIKHIDSLTEIDTVQAGSKLQYNRSDYFIVFNYAKNDQSHTAIEKYVLEYSNDFSKKFDNYHIYFYKKSSATDTNYIRNFPGGKSYKALLDETFLFEYQWYEGKLLTSPTIKQ
ncbi:hypothetical protein [Parafilimonas sp.]|uniref:hypothetical protein n=1 Tax=Parafilimonas sp. TaxID=1969739 RepID=UPI003F7FC8A3